MEFFQLSTLSYLFSNQDRRILDALQKKGISTLKDYNDAIRSNQILNVIQSDELNIIHQRIQEVVEQLQQKENQLQMYLLEFDSDNSDDSDEDLEVEETKSNQSSTGILQEQQRRNLSSLNLQSQDKPQSQLFINFFQVFSNQQEERQLQSEINTFVQYGHITEIFGVPGVGKTTFCLNYIKNHQYQTQINEGQNQALFVDFENGMMIERLIMILSIKQQHLKVEESLKRIILKNIFTDGDLIIYLQRFTEMLDASPEINFIILDGFIPKILSYLSNVDFTRKIGVTNLIANLKNYIKRRKIALILTNTVSFERQKNSRGQNINPPSEQSTVFNSFVDNKLYLFKVPNNTCNYLVPLKLNEYSEKVIDRKIPYKIEEYGIELLLSPQ